MSDLRTYLPGMLMLALAAPVFGQSAEPADELFRQQPPRPLYGPQGIHRLFDVIPAHEARLISGETPTCPVLRPRIKRPPLGPDSVQALIDFHPEQPLQIVQRPARPTYGPDGVNALIAVDPPERARLISGETPTREATPWR